jgi:hypothetical protein
MSAGNGLAERWRHWRRLAKSRMPYVRRREYTKLEQRYRALTEALGRGLPPSTSAAITALRSVEGPLPAQTALFVSYAPQPALKRHVVRHIEALLAAGVGVVLILNTPLAASELRIEPALLARLAAVYVRENVGFDFGAWAHVFTLLEERLVQCERLLLTNDSVVGPVRAGQLDAVLARARASDAPVVGLTEYHAPLRHLQSFFIVLQHGAQRSDALRRFMHEVANLPSKELVIDLYETVLTQRLGAAGLRCEALFPSLADSVFESNDTSQRWAELIELGFPFIKTSMLEKHWGDARLEATIPAEIRREYEFANAAARSGGQPK